MSNLEHWEENNPQVAATVYFLLLFGLVFGAVLLL